MVFMGAITDRKYKELSERIAIRVNGMKYDRKFVDVFRGVEYEVIAPSYHAFMGHGENIMVTASSRVERGACNGVPVIASIYINESKEGLDGHISIDTKEGDSLWNVVHKFSHRHNIETGYLLG